uniref:Uncharacterized protein n=1 Tax=Tanacetum cinerariifolium TaxID=118510 RepID=A0A699GHB7_TANCI|nr:hypothetical protein [Tanacetum cinerariifolium]
MTSFSYRLNPCYAIKECSSCGALYTRNFCCSKGNVKDKILVPKLPKNYARCGHPVDGPYCQGCALLRKKLEEDLVTYFQDFQNTSESSDDSTNVFNAPREPFVVKQDHGVNSSQNPPHIDEYAHIGYNCPPKVPIISNPDPYNQTMNNEPPQTLPSFDPTCYSEKENSLPCASKPNFVDESPNVFNPPPQPPIYSCEFCGSNAQYGHYCTPQVLFIYSELGYSQDFNFPQDFHDFQQHSRTTLMEQMEQLTSMCEMFYQFIQKKQEEKQIEEEKAANARYWKILACCDDDDDYNSAFTPVLSTEEPDNSLSMGDEHLNTIPATESDKVIKSSVEDLVPIPSESEAKDYFEIVINSNDDYSSSDDETLYNENIEYVEASPQDSELVSLEVAEIVIPEDEEIKDDNLQETNTFNNSLPEFENFCFDLEDINSGSTTTHSDISFSDYEAFDFYDDHIEEISSGNTTTQSDISLSEYVSFIFDLLNDLFPPTDRSDFTHEEFADELPHIISPPEYDCFYFRNFLSPSELISIPNFGIRENLSSTTRVNLPVEDDHSPLLTYVVWIFLAYLSYPVIPLYLHSFGNEDTIFDPGIVINRFYSFKPGLSHRCGTFKKFNTHRSHLNESPIEMLFSICFPMDQ